MKTYRVFDHTADLGIEVYGATVEELFSNGAQSLFKLIAGLYHVQLMVERNITATGGDLSDLWVNFLRECLYLFHGEGLLISDCAVVTMDHKQVTATLRGEAFDPLRHKIKQEIKAVTYHQAAVRKTTQGWTGRVILDV